MSAIRAESNQQQVWERRYAMLAHHELTTALEGEVRVSQNDGLKILASCAAVVAVSLAAVQPLQGVNVRIAPISVTIPSEQLRPPRSSQRDKTDVESYFDVTKVVQSSLTLCDATLEEVREEATMLSTTELNRREKILKVTINGTAVALIAGVCAMLLGGISAWELTPGFFAGLGVLGSCGIQLNKVDAQRKH
ncbi:MAG: hypothetical protein ACRCYW_16580 [Aeromonas sp.]|uniref:hypothetical protein n=1 Tax=Aeromonas sp. TaxID=647 RepID=UPI003F29F706